MNCFWRRKLDPDVLNALSECTKASPKRSWKNDIRRGGRGRRLKDIAALSLPPNPNGVVGGTAEYGSSERTKKVMFSQNLVRLLHLERSQDGHVDAYTDVPDGRMWHCELWYLPRGH